MNEDTPPRTEPEAPVLRWRARALYIAIIVVGLASIALTGAFSLLFFDGDGATETKTLVIPKGAGVRSVAQLLEEHRLIADASVFVLGVRLHQAQTELRAGEYTVPQGATMAQILTMLRTGDTVSRRLSIPEGLTAQQIITRLENVGALSGSVVDVPAEGSLLPETYYYSLKDSRQDIIDRMQVAMQKSLADLWPQRQEGLPIKTPEEALILASIIERETSRNGERAHIAGVFINRLRQGIKLQSDPTIIYGLTGGEPLGRGLRRSEIKAKTPYNTYHFKGLPPTPISNPGIEALTAVLHPLETEDLFFVADGHGGHAFAVTYRQHKRNVKAWRKLLKSR
jgi:UPF0755 protein